MTFIRIVYLSIGILFLSVCFQCNSPSLPLETSTTSVAGTQSNIPFTLLRQDVPYQGIQWNTVNLKDSMYKGHSGICITAEVALTSTAFEQLPAAYHAFWADASVLGDSGFNYRSIEYPQFEKNTFYPSTPHLIQQAKQITLHFHLPYRKLSPASGKTSTVTLSVGLYPIAFTSDRNRTQSKLCALPSTDAAALQTIECTVILPPIETVTVEVQSVELNTQKKPAGSYDIAMGGTGLPDIYWQVWCGNELVFFSPTIKNTLSLTEASRSSSLRVGASDELTLRILDYDNGPFNQDDVLAEWKGTIKELKEKKVWESPLLKNAKVLLK